MKITQQEFWKKQLKYFIVEHPFFQQFSPDEEIFTPQKDLKIRFWFEGNLQIEGEYEDLEINYNSKDMLILAKKTKGLTNIFRLPWDRLISFELILGDEANEELKRIIKLN